MSYMSKHVRGDWCYGGPIRETSWSMPLSLITATGVKHSFCQ